MSTLVEHRGTRLAELVRAAAETDPGADLAIVRAGAPLPDGRLEQLETALAGAGDEIAAATAATVATGGGFGSFRPDPACTLIRAQAFALLGGLDPVFTHPGAALADFAARARGLGLACAVVPMISAAAEPDSEWPAADRALLAERHPWLRAACDEEAALDAGPLKRALLAARTARDGISVTIDARSLGSGVGGTQTYVGALVIALARSGRVRVRAVLADPETTSVARAFAEAGAEVVGYEQAASGALPLTDVVHRPQQVFTPSDLRLLELLGERLVISHMDLIAYRAPTYHASVDDWQAYRRTTRLALSVADEVLFFSEHARRDALAEDLLPADRASVAGIGVERASDIEPRRPARLPDRPLIVMIGADYAHKNRPFAVALVEALRERHSFDGVLVFAGTHVPFGASPAVARHEHVVDLGPVTEAEKAWLAANAIAHLAPSAYEGFGLAPLEAAAAGRPCIYAPVTSLREIIDPAASTIVPWDPVASAAGAAALLKPGPARDRHLELLDAALRTLTWERVIPAVLEGYGRAVVSPYRAAAARAWAELAREEYIIVLAESLEHLHARVDDGLPLIDARQSLLRPDQQRGLMRVASRPWLRGPLLGGFGLLGRVGSGRQHVPPADVEARDSAP